MSASGDNELGDYLKDRRARLDPARFGIPTRRRRTPGLRREEVAQRANVSATWYTWLEQGRGGVPSADVLDRIARALELTPAEREHLFLLAQHRPPEVRYSGKGKVTPQLQRVLESLSFSPAYVRNSTWDILAWNRASQALADYAAIPAEQRNILRLMFSRARLRHRSPNWEQDARAAVAALRADAARAGASEPLKTLVAEMSALSAEFAEMWEARDVRIAGAGTKHLHHPELGPITLEYSSFTVDGEPDLAMVVYNPVSEDDAARMRALIAARLASHA